ncbi:PEP-CTERM sorting domain-containing protein|uniref:PEP-CTERM sorting domain-containing protein n=1 Tax=Noviherbaspirillum sp. L7-7A TaxID=2850560 RepID=UPI001C2BB676|nr:PEP-CTERM sorting domain-containing protein [Noviherbaspirillum sp. L7-7A]MBV0881094.1 PEP-CTERM sorting domain-containing protein [Noviherbaspirillum sp. L7-7A]
MNISKIKNVLATGGFVLASLAGSTAANASVIYEFSNAGLYGTTSANATGIFATAEFTDVVNGVQLVMKVLSSLSPSQYVNDWAFNLNTTGNTSISTVTSKGGVSAPTVTKTLDNDSFGNASNSGLFDLVFNFAASGSNKDLSQNGSSTYLITGTNLSSDDFLIANSKNIYASIQVEGGNTNNTYIRQVNSGGVASAAVPEPTMVALMGLGLLGFAAARRKSAKTKNA